MEPTIKLGGVQVVDKTVDACGHMHIPLPLNLGTVDIDALASCPAPAGPVNVNIQIANKVALPKAVAWHSVTKDVNGNTALCLDGTITPA
eukprot:gene601-22778_t